MRIRLFGRFDLGFDGAAIPPLESARAESLIAYLLLEGTSATSRRRLAFLLWPDSTEAQAQTNLRHVLHKVRHRLPEADRHLDITARSLRWRSEAPHWVDVDAFEQLLAVDTAARPDALREAVDLYTGDLLEGLFDEWLLPERERLRNRYLDALAELAGLRADRGEMAEAIGLTERLLRADPLRETTYQRLMRLHDATGDRARALRAYHVCSSTLEHELGVEPGAETRAAYQALLRAVPAAAAVGMPPKVVRVGPLVGRADERSRLTAALRATDAGRAQFVLVSGEAGVGKTRLVEEFRAWCSRRGLATADARCYSAEGTLAYGPVVAWLQSSTLRPRLPRLSRAHLTDLARLLPELLAELPDLERPELLPVSDQRTRLFDAVSAALRTAGPVLLVVDDLQYADRDTCQLVHYLLRIQPDARLLVVATAREEDLDTEPLQDLLAGLRARERCEEIALARLNREDTATLAERLTGAPITSSDAERLHAETEGSPLFVVEAVRAGWSVGQPLSPRVQSVIEARLAQVSTAARDLAGAAAAIGREFRIDVLAAATDTSEDALVHPIDELWRRRIIRERGEAAGGDSYDFSHDKIRQVAYAGINPTRRRRLHGRIAAALERVHAADPGSVSAQIAAHHEHAGAATQAVDWYRRAAAAAQLLHADQQAIHLLDRASALLATRPDIADRDAIELDVRIAMLSPLIPAGYAAAAMSATQQRALELTRKLGVATAPPLLRSLALSALTTARFEAAGRYGEELQQTADCEADDVVVVEAAYVQGIAAFWQSDLHAARRHFETAVGRYRPEHRGIHLMRFGQDPRVICQTRLANTLWFLGRPDAAREAGARGLAWAAEIEHPFSTMTAHTFVCLLAVDMDDEQAVREHTAALQVDEVDSLNRCMASGMAGYVAVLDGATERGIAAVRDAVRDASERPGAPGQAAILARVLLAACVASGNAAAAVDAANRLLEMGGPARLWDAVARSVRDRHT